MDNVGTRNLTAVYIDGQYKVAQYGRWDGYPEGQGITCLRFCKTLRDKNAKEVFKEKVRCARWITDEEIELINKKIETKEITNWKRIYPQLSRDICSKILYLIMEKEKGIVLANNIDFAANSVFCEWAWVIDLDNNTFEAYCGFNEENLTEKDRFYFLHDKSKDIYPIRLVAKWSLNKLPSEKRFLDTFINVNI